MTGSDRAVADEAEAVDAALFRDGMSRIAAAVHVVTTDGPAGRAGGTMTAVSSVSDAPPTVLVCINRAGRLAAVARENGVFCINTLVEGDEALSGAFAGVGGLSPDERFRLGAWRPGVTGAPVLTSGRVALECRLAEVSEVGSHSVLFGTVVAVHVGDERAPLLYVDRAYRVLPPSAVDA